MTYCPFGCGSVLVWRPADGPHEQAYLYCYIHARSPGPRRVLAPDEQPADSGSSMYKQHHKGIPRSEWPTQSGRHPTVETPQGHSERRHEWPVQGAGIRGVQRQHQHGITAKGRE